MAVRGLTIVISCSHCRVYNQFAYVIHTVCVWQWKGKQTCIPARCQVYTPALLVFPSVVVL